MKSSKENNGTKPLSELEGVCLGLVFRYQPCTAYRVRQLLKESPSSHWSASAGSVYPLLARLEEARLVNTESDDNDGRGRKQLSITRAGRAALRRWIGSGAEVERVAAIMDPIRSRTFFLDALSKTGQVDYLEQLIVLTENYLEQLNLHLETQPETEDLYDHLGARGAVMATEAQLAWLKLVLRSVKRQIKKTEAAPDR